MTWLRDLYEYLEDISPLLPQLILALVVLILAVVLERLLVRVLRRAYWRRVELAAEARGVGQLTRMKRQKTLVTLLESLTRYGVYGAAVILVIGILSPGVTSALFGASLIVVLVGFGLQRLLGDVVAGALLLFEGHFAVGDVITLHQQNLTGTVEEFSLRTTTLRTLGGDRVTLLNGTMTAFTRWSYGQREFRLEMLVRDEQAVASVEALCAREAGVPGSLWITPPTASRVGDDGAPARVRICAVIAPGHEDIVDWLAGLVVAELGDSIVGAVQRVSVYLPVFEPWRAGLLIRE